MTNPNSKETKKPAPTKKTTNRKRKKKAVKSPKTKATRKNDDILLFYKLS